MNPFKSVDFGSIREDINNRNPYTMELVPQGMLEHEKDLWLRIGVQLAWPTKEDWENPLEAIERHQAEPLENAVDPWDGSLETIALAFYDNMRNTATENDLYVRIKESFLKNPIPPRVEAEILADARFISAKYALSRFMGGIIEDDLRSMLDESGTLPDPVDCLDMFVYPGLIDSIPATGAVLASFGSMLRSVFEVDPNDPNDAWFYSEELGIYVRAESPAGDTVGIFERLLKIYNNPVDAACIQETFNKLALYPYVSTEYLKSKADRPGPDCI